MIVSPGTYARQLRAAADKLDVALPEQFTAALATAAKLAVDAEQFDAVVAELNARTLDLLLAGKDPTTYKEVGRLAVGRVLADAGLRQAGIERAAHLVGEAIEQHSDEILDQWIAAVQIDCDTLTDSVAQLGDIADLRGADVTQLKNSNRLGVWSSAMSAFDRVDAYTAGFRAIVTALELPHERAHWALQFTGDITAVEAINTVLGAAPPDAWTCVTIGAPLTLANVATFVERIADFNAAERDRQRRLEEDRQPTGFDGQRREAATL